MEEIWKEEQRSLEVEQETAASEEEHEMEQETVASEEAYGIEQGTVVSEEAHGTEQTISEAKEVSQVCSAESKEWEMEYTGVQLCEELAALRCSVLQLDGEMRNLAVSADATARQVNQVNENLHEENLRLKEGLYETLTKPILRDIIATASDMLRDAKRYEKAGQEEAAEAIRSSVEDIHTMLEKHNVEAYQFQEGEKYEPIRQKVIGTVDTEDIEKDQTVARSDGYGYSFSSERGTSIVLAPCKVYAYKLK